MFVKKIKSKNSVYLKIVHSYWDKKLKKTRQKVILNLGKLDNLMSNGLPTIVDKLVGIIKEETDTSNLKNISKLRDISTMRGIAQTYYGFIIFRKLWNKFKINQLIKSLLNKTKVEFDFSSVVFSMVVNQLQAPSSKFKLWQEKEKYLDINKEIDLQHYYRSLDILSVNKEKIEHFFYERNKNLFNMSLDIVFYDVTTFYFESQKSDELKDFGFDKDNKINNVHIVMGLLVDKYGRPIGYELFKGNTYEGKTLLKTIEKISKRFEINKVVIVADKGLNSKMNFKDIKDAGYDYIVSGRLKSMSKKTKDIVLDMDNYKFLTEKDLSFLDEDYNLKEDSTNNKTFMYKVLDYENEVKYKINPKDKRYKKIKLKEKLICTYSSKRASKDKKDRERMLEKAQEIIDSKEKSRLQNHRGHKKYVVKQYPENVKGEDFEMILNIEKIKAEQKYDGFYVIQSSKEDLSAKDVIENYHYLYKIEESFRIMKTTMKFRPINHWTPKRIEGHFVMCFIAFLLERDLEYTLLKNNKTKAPEQVKQAINSMEFTKIKIENKLYYLRSSHNKLASEIMAVLKIKQAGHLLDESQIKNYMEMYFKTE